LLEEFKVNEETLKKTDDCTKDFSCISPSGDGLCKVEETTNSNVHLIECKDIIECNYRFPFGDAYFCQCPTREEILTVYGV